MHTRSPRSALRRESSSISTRRASSPPPSRSGEQRLLRGVAEKAGGNIAANREKKKKILLVDDSLTALMLHRMVLGKSAYELVTARDGREAVEKALAERPDLIVMDVVMPQLDGFQACRRLRAIEQTRGTPIILVTTRGEAESITNGFASGCTDYITKPVNGLEMLSKVKSYLGD